MKKKNRIILLILILIFSVLNLISLIDMIQKFWYIFSDIDIFFDIEVYFVFALSSALAVVTIPTAIYHVRKLNPKKEYPNELVLDENKIEFSKPSKFTSICNVVFGSTLIVIGMFLIKVSINDYNNQDSIILLMVVIILLLGTGGSILRDMIKLKTGYNNG